MVVTEIIRLDERKWCPHCKEVVGVDEYVEYEDGFVFYVAHRCSNCGEDDLEDYHECPICGEEIPDNEEFCGECYTDINQKLTEIMEEWHIDADTLQDLIITYYNK